MTQEVGLVLRIAEMEIVVFSKTLVLTDCSKTQIQEVPDGVNVLEANPLPLILAFADGKGGLDQFACFVFALVVLWVFAVLIPTYIYHVFVSSFFGVGAFSAQWGLLCDVMGFDCFIHKHPLIGSASFKSFSAPATFLISFSITSKMKNYLEKPTAQRSLVLVSHCSACFSWFSALTCLIQIIELPTVLSTVHIAPQYKSHQPKNV